MTDVAGTPLPIVEILKIEPNVDSVKVTVKPVDGAMDYRISRVDNPKEFKYFGQRREKKGTTPITDVDLNGLPFWEKPRCIVEALRDPGPYPPCNLMNRDGSHVYPEDGHDDDMCMPYANAGPTPDGSTSINGQGYPTNVPVVLARSAPFSVQSSGQPPAGHWLLFDTFASGKVVPVSIDPTTDTAAYKLITPVSVYAVQLNHADVDRSCVEVDHRHLMTVLSDGGTPGKSPNPVHSGHGALSVRPVKTFPFAGKELVVRVECDLFTTNRRWPGLNVSPASDPMTDFYALNAVNKTNRGLRVEFFPTSVVVTQFTGFDASGKAKRIVVAGDAGQALHYSPRKQNGRGIDNRSLIQCNLSQNRLRVWEDSILVVDVTLPESLGFDAAVIDITTYKYHTDNELFLDRGLAVNQPWETFLVQLLPDGRRADKWGCEFHWDNLAVGVIPVTLRQVA